MECLGIYLLLEPACLGSCDFMPPSPLASFTFKTKEDKHGQHAWNLNEESPSGEVYFLLYLIRS